MSFAKALFLTMLTCALAGAVVLGILQFADIDRPTLPATSVAQSAPPTAPANPVVRIVTETEPLTFALTHKNLRLDQVISPCGPRTFVSPDANFHAFDLFACAVEVPARQSVAWLVTFPDGAEHCSISGKWQAVGGKHNDVEFSVESIGHWKEHVRGQRGYPAWLELPPGQYRVTIDNRFEPLSEKFVGGEITASYGLGK